MIDEDAPQPCLKCGVPVSKDGLGEPDLYGAVFMGAVAPLHSGAPDGSDLHRQLEITVCGECLASAGRAGRVLLYSIPASQPEVSRWSTSSLRVL